METLIPISGLHIPMYMCAHTHANTIKMKKEKRILNLKNNINLGAREMAQNLGVIAALLEAPCSIPSLHMAAYNYLQLQFQGHRCVHVADNIL